MSDDRATPDRLVGRGHTDADSHAREPRLFSLGPAGNYLRGLGTPKARETGRKGIRAIARVLGSGDPASVEWGRITRAEVQYFLQALQDQGLAPATQRLYLSVLRGVMHEAWALEWIDGDTLARIREVRPPKGSRLPAGRAMDLEEMEAIIGRTERDRRPKGVRDAALLHVLYTSGIRRSEVVALSLSDLLPESGGLRVRGKGDRERIAYVDDRAWAALNRWVDEVRGDGEPGPLFLPITRGGHLRWRKLSDQAVARIVQERARAAASEKTNPHDLRRSFITQLLDNEVDVLTVQELAGHASVSTTQMYDRRGEDGKRQAVSALRARKPRKPDC